MTASDLYALLTSADASPEAIAAIGLLSVAGIFFAAIRQDFQDCGFAHGLRAFIALPVTVFVALVECYRAP